MSAATSSISPSLRTRVATVSLSKVKSPLPSLGSIEYTFSDLYPLGINAKVGLLILFVFYLFLFQGFNNIFF
jgi:hypothetical protein